MDITGIVLTKNEESNIIDCLEGILFCSEIIIVDDNSTDRTIELIKEFSKTHKKVKLFSRELGIDFSAQRNFGIEKATNDWIFFVDADERISKDLVTEVKENVTPNTPYAGFLIPRRDYMWGKELKHGETGSIKLLRLFNKKNGELIGKVHERWESKGQVGRFVNPILHYPHPTISEFLREINFYSDLRAQELYSKGVKASYFTIVAYPKGKFIVNYLLKLGVLDGVPGLVHAILMSLHSFLVRGKLWLLWQKK